VHDSQALTRLPLIACEVPTPGTSLFWWVERALRPASSRSPKEMAPNAALKGRSTLPAGRLQSGFDLGHNRLRCGGRVLGLQDGPSHHQIRCARSDGISWREDTRLV